MENQPILQDGNVVTTTAVPLADYVKGIQADIAQRLQFITDTTNDVNAKVALLNGLIPPSTS